ncbi:MULTISPECIES: methyl-accepting chemotaxis protein [Vibrio]|uniref:Methyl-accepting chemotaxis protein n=1 Tax=Vibrio anguillarum TaxID=55601 RepID=A0AAW4B9V4_VIBAN|nr:MULTISPECIES: methyl-accepting chemotaxis protein [Vibrio]ASG09472.1 methyl-accepting chemotaxis protein [Vibrio anguillarum]ASO30758.1 methyl-accepting chemotaxis protein [Vibrio anguillarum]MBF4255613.1 methyl-accepting chemotaxis protein [Vibrio anguillarum]MBF4276274.1 methyl-accepting chemotaxis protein [Vibrio anguillarum]MBF4299285.1 methyl-accepting chemotaxis protein [Vibrio anguillarum]
MTLGFKSRIYVSVALLVAISLIVLGTINMLSLKEKMITSLTTETQNKLNYHVSELESWVKTRYQAVVKGSQHFRSALSDQENVNLVRLLAESAQISNVIMAYDDGRAYMSFDKDNGVVTGQQNFTSRDWYQQAKTSRTAQVTEIYEDKITGKQVISVVMPVYQQSRFIGVLLGDIQLDEVIVQVSNMRFAGGAATLTDKHAVFFASDDPSDIGRTPSQVSPNFLEMEKLFSQQDAGHLSFPYLGIEFDGYFKRVNLTDNMYWTMMVFVDKGTALANVYEAQSSAIYTGVILLIISVAAIFVILNYIYKPLLRLKKAVLDLSKGSGDLTRRLEVNGDDDLAQISQGFNLFSENLQKMMLQISDASQNISSNIEQLGQTAKENERMLLSHSSETEQVVTAITEMSESARTVAESVTQSNHITDSASKEAKQSIIIVNNAVETVSSLVSDVEQMSERIANMNKDAIKISEVLTVIGAISEQTNLLALNAAIEAARAGEQGRGFAVVADEVRALAARTQNSTTEISDMLAKLLEGTDSVVAAMDKTKNQCQTTADKTSEVSGSLNIMSTSVSEIDDLSTQIAAATEQQSTVAEELSRNMLAIRDIVESLVVSGRQTVSATESLSYSNHELDRLVSNFKLK